MLVFDFSKQTTNLKACNSSLVTLCMLSHSLGSGSWDPIYCSPPGSSVHGIFQAKILEWVAIPSTGEVGGNFPTQGSNLDLLCLLHCRWILYPLRHWGSQSKLFRVLTVHIHELLLWHSMVYFLRKHYARFSSYYERYLQTCPCLQEIYKLEWS